MPMFQTQQNVYPEQMLHEPQHELDYSQMDFEKAFASAFQDAESMNVDQVQGKGKEIYRDILHKDGTYTNDHSSDTINYDRPQDTIRIGSDAIQYTEQKDRTADQDTRDADELARTAGQLLSSVQHDTSTKFQESQFLALLRKIRDREVEVREEEFKPTTPAGSTFEPITERLSKYQSNQPDGQSVTDLRPHDPNSFQFPDLNQVYDPDGFQNDEFSFNDDQIDSHTAFQPQPQVQSLHPGGKWYPEQSPPPVSHNTMPPHMSGGILPEEF
jgi:hypothetical protein